MKIMIIINIKCFIIKIISILYPIYLLLIIVIIYIYFLIICEKDIEIIENDN